MFSYSLIFVLIIAKSQTNILNNIAHSAVIVYDKVFDNTLGDADLVNIAKAIINVTAKIPIPFIYSSRSIKDIIYNVMPDFNISLNNEDANLNIEDLLIKYNRQVETHEVTTIDGYILKMFRIPSNSTPCLLMHGLISSADDFVTAGPDTGLAYVLSDKGFDVWLGNARGTKHSQRHQYLEPSSPTFWDFSWHEIGIFDLPAMIDYILNKTGKKSLKYVGHSQGTTTFYVLNSERPEYNEKISQMISLAPIAYLSNTKSLLVRMAASFHNILYITEKALGFYEVFPNDGLTNALKKLVCAGLGDLFQIVCYKTHFLFGGFDLQQLNITNLPVVIGHFPSVSSLKQFDHYIQEVNSGKFAKYDYGALQNMVLYGMDSPPEYNLKLVKVPVYLFYSEGDYLAQPADVAKLSKELANVVEMYEIPYKKFNHVDFLFGKDVKTMVYDKILDIFQL